MSCDFRSFRCKNIWVSEVSHTDNFFLPRPLLAHSTRPNPRSPSFTRYFFNHMFSRPLSAHYARPSPKTTFVSLQSRVSFLRSVRFAHRCSKNHLFCKKTKPSFCQLYFPRLASVTCVFSQFSLVPYVL